MGDQKIDAGSLVENTLKPDWGPGKAVHANEEYIFVIFRDLPHREAKQFLRQDNPLRKPFPQGRNLRSLASR